MSDHPGRRSQRVSAAMFGVAAIVFVLTAVLGQASSGTAFIVLGMAFAVLALDAWRSGQGRVDVPDEERPTGRA